MPSPKPIAVALTAAFTIWMSAPAKAEPVSPVDTQRFAMGQQAAPLETTAEAEWLDSVEFVSGDEAYFEHEMNDAWLGMPVIGIKGIQVGVVVDAPLDADGEVAEIHVSGEKIDWSGEEPVLIGERSEVLVFKGDQIALEDDHVALLPMDSELVANLAD